MRLVHHGNACFSLFYRNKHLLLDPWIQGPAVAGGWTHFPPTQSKMSSLPKIDYIFISHIHSDHCEKTTLDLIDPKVPIILMEREPNFLKKYLLSLGFENLILVPPGALHQVESDFSVEVFGESFGHLCSNIIDSSIVFNFVGGEVFLNCNDNKPSAELCDYIKTNYKNLDLALIPAGGGSGFPAMYENFTFEEKQNLSQKIINNYSEVFTTAVDIMQPKIVVPVAGGYAIRGPLAESVNWVQCRRLNNLEVVDYYKSHSQLAKSQTKILPMQPGMELDTESDPILKGEFHVWTKEELGSFFNSLSKEIVETKIKSSSPLSNMNSILSQARRNLWNKQTSNHMKPDYRVYFDIPGQNSLFEVDLKSENIKHIPRSASSALKTPFLKLSLPQDTLLEWLLGLEDFNMLDSGHRISFLREPRDCYVQEAYYLMSLFRLA